jgi:hypothetical protein
MNPRRFATVAPALCGTVVLAGWIVAWLAGFGSAGIKNIGAVPIEDQRSISHRQRRARRSTAGNRNGQRRYCQRGCGDGRRIGDGDGYR